MYVDNYQQQQLNMQMASNPMFAGMMPTGVVNGVFMFMGNPNSLPVRI